MNKVRVLQILDELNTGGAEKIVTSYYKHIDHDIFQWDFVITKYDDLQKRGLLEDFVEKSGGNIFRVTRKRESYLKNIKDTEEVIRNGRYDIVHSHLDELSYPYLHSAKKCEVPVRICHSHLAGAKRGKSVEVLCKIYKPLLDGVVTDRFACGEMAGRALWGNKSFHIMKNAIEVDDFKFNEEKRIRLRNKYNCQNKVVLGTVGRLSYQKNSIYLIDIFKEYHYHNTNSVLWIIGEGDLKDQVINQIEKYNLEDSVKLFGARDDVSDLLNAMDVFLLPSIFEGLPIVLVEAQCNGLPCVVSNNVTREVKVNDKVAYLDLNELSNWRNTIIKFTSKTADRAAGAKRIEDAGYDISSASKNLQDYYLRRVRDSKL